MKDQAKKLLVTPISGPSPRRLLRSAWAGAVATVVAGGLLFTASASVPVAHVPDGPDVPVQLHGPSESVPVGPSETAPEDARRRHVVTVLERADQGKGLSSRENLATVEVRGPEERQGFSLRESLLGVVTMFGGSTLGYANGRIPAAVLCLLAFAPGHMLRCDAAERLAALSEAFEREFGYPIPITDSYRSYIQQIAVASAKPHLAAVPGTSNHGWGLAVDLSHPIAGGASREYVWLRVHGPSYGWDNPPWARPGGAKPEPWHFEFFATGPVPHRAANPADVGTWGSADPSGSSAGASPRYKPALDPKPKDGSTADEVHKPPTGPAGGPSAGPPAQRPSQPAAKPAPSDPTSKPPTPTTSPAPAPSPSPSEADPEPSTSPSPTPIPSPVPSSTPTPNPAPAPSGPGPEPSASPSPSPARPKPSQVPTPTPTPSAGGEAPRGPAPSPSPSVSSGPLSSLAKGLGLSVGDAED